MGVPPAPPGAAALGVGGGGAMRVAMPASARQAENAHASRNSAGSSERRASSPAKDCTNFRPRSATCIGIPAWEGAGRKMATIGKGNLPLSGVRFDTQGKV